MFRYVQNRDIKGNKINTFVKFTAFNINTHKPKIFCTQASTTTEIKYLCLSVILVALSVTMTFDFFRTCRSTSVSLEKRPFMCRTSRSQLSLGPLSVLSPSWWRTSWDYSRYVWRSPTVFLVYCSNLTRLVSILEQFQLDFDGLVVDISKIIVCNCESPKSTYLKWTHTSKIG